MERDVSDDIMQVMETIEYGFLDKKGENIYNKGENEWNKFNEFYFLLTPDELLEKSVEFVGIK